MIINNINKPDDLKKLTIEEMQKLASEIRNILVKKASICGGHVGSNLGVIELTIALHYVFNSPIDKFVFDVSHQCYTHKILTGRKDAFLDSEKYSSVNGFTNPEESKHDFFKIGHSSTSISLACGLAKARDLNGRQENIIAIIGDAALGGGEAFEGLNYAGSELDSNLIIVVNDNQMSIAENHGGLYGALAELRENEGLGNNIFRTLGFDYYYVKNGNNLKELIDVFKLVKDAKKPVVIHAVTEKGKGYLFAEKNKESWHWRRPFDIETGELINPFNGRSYDKILNDYLLEKMENDSSVVALAAGVPLTSGFSIDKRKIAGKQFVDVGIMEEHAITMLAGIVANGGKPVFTTDCTFYQRVYDQVSHDVCLNSLPVTMLVRNASIWGMTDCTHLGFFDIAIFSNIPNLILLAPTNVQEYLAMLDWSIEQTKYPVMIRIPRFVFDSNRETITNFDEINKNEIVIKGNGIAIIAVGDFFKLGEDLQLAIKNEFGIDATLINPLFINSIDKECLDKIKESHSIIITLEDGVIEGGYGQKVASYLGICKNVVVKNYGLRKEFLDRYDANLVMKENHLTVPDILNDLKEYL